MPVQTIIRAISTRMLLSLQLGIGLLPAMLPAKSGAVLIDDFSVPQGPLINAPCAAPPPTSAVSGNSIVGIERDAQAGSNCGSGLTGVTSFEVANGVAKTSADSNGEGQSGLTYDGAGSPSDLAFNLNVDLTDAGSSDRFIIDVSSVTGTVSVLIHVGPTVIFPFLQSRWVPVTAPGTVEILFADFHLVGAPPPDPAFNPAVGIFIAVHVTAESSIEIDRICTGNDVANCTLSTRLLNDNFDD